MKKLELLLCSQFQFNFCIRSYRLGLFLSTEKVSNAVDFVFEVVQSKLNLYLDLEVNESSYIFVNVY